MNRSVLFYAAIALVVVTIAMAIYYLIPSVYHPHLSLHHGFTFVKNSHRIYVAGFFVLALVWGILAFILRPVSKRAPQAPL